MNLKGGEGPLEEERAGDYLFSVHSKFKLYDKRSLMCLRGETRLRRKLVWLVEWPLFENLILFCIFLNSISLAVYDYSDRENLTVRNNILEQAGLIFNAIFTFEALVKISAMGFVMHRNSYLREGFNVIDFVVVVSG